MIGPLGLAVMFWLASVAMVYALLATPVEQGNRGLMNLTESLGSLERVALWQRALWWLPGAEAGGGFISWSPLAINWTVRAALVAMFALHAWAFWRCWRGEASSLGRWLVGPIGAHVIMLGFVPSNADVFYYGMSGDLANNGNNPYLFPLYQFPDHPLLPYNHWVDMKAVYGPFWTAISQGIVAVSGPDPVAAVLGFKIFLGVSAIGLALFVAWLTQRLTGSRQLGLAAGVLVAWQPNLIIESSGQAHNDAVMLLLATAGLGLAVLGGARSLRGAIVLVAASAVVKYVTLPLLGLLALVRLKDIGRDGVVRTARAWGLDALAAAAVVVAAFAPFWVGAGTLAEMLTEPGRLFNNPLWYLPYLGVHKLAGDIVDPVFFVGIRLLLMLATIAVLAWIAVWLGRQLSWGKPASDERSGSLLPWWTGRLLTAWTAVLATLALLPVNSHAWYWTWPIVPVALLVTFRASAVPVDGVGPALPRWFWSYLVLTALLTLAYHTRVVHF
ncbi:MAG: hypothetical protein H0W06_06695 [Chloroflexia bacterium]|nr:hypothetical protein [Chloroflexia bacterium]